MNFVKSTNIEVFPCGFRESDFVKSKLTSEENLTSMACLYSKYAKNNCFFITDPSDSTKVVIGLIGYIFKLNESDIPSGSKYAYIKLRSVDDKYGKVLSNLKTPANTTVDEKINESDDDYSFVALAFDSTLPSSENSYSAYVDISDKQELRVSSDEVRDRSTDESISNVFSTSEIDAGGEDGELDIYATALTIHTPKTTPIDASSSIINIFGVNADKMGETDDRINEAYFNTIYGNSIYQVEEIGQSIIPVTNLYVKNISANAVYSDAIGTSSTKIPNIYVSDIYTTTEHATTVLTGSVGTSSDYVPTAYITDAHTTSMTVDNLYGVPNNKVNPYYSSGQGKGLEGGYVYALTMLNLVSGKTLADNFSCTVALPRGGSSSRTIQLGYFIAYGTNNEYKVLAQNTLSDYTKWNIVIEERDSGSEGWSFGTFSIRYVKLAKFDCNYWN